MRLAAAILTASILTACGSAAATTPTPASGAGATEAAILASDGDVLRPIANGGRVALREGWATIRFSSLASERADLDVALFDVSGRSVRGDVRVSYASLDMDHGSTTTVAAEHEGAYRVPLEFVMPGRWRLVVRITRGDVQETLTILLPEVGL